MIDSRRLWETILFDNGGEQTVVLRFTDMAEFLSTSDDKPHATDVVWRIFDNMRYDVCVNTSIESVFGIDQLLEKELSAIDIPESLVVEVTEHVYEELPPENEDVVKWDIDVQ